MTFRPLALFLLAGMAACSADDPAHIVGQTLHNTAVEWCRTARQCSVDDEARAARAGPAGR